MLHSRAYLINGRFDAAITPFDRGFAYGDGVFRTMPCISGIPHCWPQHYAKLESDCNALSIVCPQQETLFDDIQKLCREPDWQHECVIKVVITRGESGRGYALPALAQPNRVVIASAAPGYPETNFSEGVTLHLCQTRLSYQPRLAGIKHLNRLENVLARMEWVDGQIADGLFLDEKGNVIECTASNIFVRIGNDLVTPDLTQCGVAGVTRGRIIDLASVLGYTVRIKPIRLSELMDAEEVVICSSVFGAWQVRRLVSHSWPLGALAARLREHLKRDDAAN